MEQVVEREEVIKIQFHWQSEQNHKFNKLKSRLININIFKMALESLKKQMDEMDAKIKKIESDIDKKTKLITELEQNYEKITTQLTSEKKIFASLEENKNYLIDIKRETESNFKQINDAASTLLEILKSKTDKL
jgi:chromosome segregation ATPase